MQPQDKLDNQANTQQRMVTLVQTQTKTSQRPRRAAVAFCFGCGSRDKHNFSQCIKRHAQEGRYFRHELEPAVQIHREVGPRLQPVPADQPKEADAPADAQPQLPALNIYDDLPQSPGFAELDKLRREIEKDIIELAVSLARHNVKESKPKKTAFKFKRL